MEVSWIGLGVCIALLIVCRFLGDMLLIGLLASLAFGTTSVVTLTALGGASPLIFIVPLGMLIASVFFRRDFKERLEQAMSNGYASGLVLALGLYAVMGAYIMPRLFRGGAVALITTRDLGVVEAPLIPNSGNITQTMYLVFGCLAFFSFIVVLTDKRRLNSIRLGYIALAFLIVTFGVVDFAGKMLGLGDVLVGIRTVTYALLTDTEEAGFARLAGSFSEASAFAAASLPMLAFCYAFWKQTGARWAAWLSVLLLLLNLASTSSTSLGGLGLLSVPMFVSIVKSLFYGRVHSRDAKVIAAVVLVVASTLAILIIRPQSLDPFIAAFDRIILSKAQTESGQERAYWNAVAIQNIFDTYGLGIGMGSSRASSWALAAASQLGVIGIMLLALLTVFLWRRIPDPGTDNPDLRAAVALANSARAAALAALAVGSISGSSADPGLCFFSAIAVVQVVRNWVAVERLAARREPSYHPGHSFSMVAYGDR